MASRYFHKAEVHKMLDSHFIRSVAGWEFFGHYKLKFGEMWWREFLHPVSP
jgi:hypothetical protein